VVEDIGVGSRVEVPIRADPSQVRPAVADTMRPRPPVVRAEAALQADRMADLHMAVTVTAKKFIPRFTPHLTHRQEAPKGASCPP
jgi:hypothetical protein